MDKKKVFIINASPRKNWNLDELCKNFSKGVSDKGTEAEIIYLYDINFKGCQSCFACKLKNGKNYAKCSYPDELKQVLEKITMADAIVFATPVYFGDVSGVMKMFIERLFFPFVKYDKNYTSLAKKIKTAVIYTMNVKKEIFEEFYLGKDNKGPIGFFETWIEKVYTKPKRICAFDTFQFSDYSKYESEVWDKEAKLKQKQEIFPLELKKAYEAGESFLE